MTGAIIRPSLSNGPLPRLKPQPEHISMMIRQRRLAYDRSNTKINDLELLAEDLKSEANFEDGLVQEAAEKGFKLDSVFASGDWSESTIWQNIYNRY